MGAASVDLRDRQHRGIGDRHLPRDIGLQRQHDLACDGNRIEAIVRHRTVSAAAVDRRTQRIGRGEKRPGPADERAGGRVGRDVQREGRFGFGDVQQPVVDHVTRAVIALLAGLEHEDDGAGQIVLAR